MKFFRRTFGHLPSMIAPMLLLATCSLAAQSNPQNQKQTRQSQQQPEVPQRGTEAAPIVVKTLPVVPTKEQTAQEAADRDRREQTEKWTFRLAVATVMVGLLQAFIYWKQARSLRDTIGKMDEIAKAQAVDMAAYIAQTTRFAAGVEGIVAAMSANLVLLEDALKINKEISETNKRIADTNFDSYRATQRAYLHISQISIEWGKSDPRIFVLVVNSGKLIGTITGWAADCVLEPLAAIPDTSELTHYGNHGPVAPDGGLVTLEAAVPLNWTTDDWKALLNAGRSLNLWGIISCDTGFPDIPGELGFGYEFVPGGPQSAYGQRFAATDAPGYNYSK